MSKSWNQYSDDVKSGPRKTVKILVLAGLAVMVLIIGGLVIGTCNETATVAREEFGARALLDKYEWFKTAAAQLDKKRADLAVYETRFSALKESYGDAPRSAWAREDREQFNLWASEVSGIAASYNALAAEYNAQMAKFNWRFANAGELPQGADTPLPREFRAYITQ